MCLWFGVNFGKVKKKKFKKIIVRFFKMFRLKIWKVLVDRGMNKSSGV